MHNYFMFAALYEYFLMNMQNNNFIATPHAELFIANRLVWAVHHTTSSLW